MNIHGIELTEEELNKWVQRYIERLLTETERKKYVEQAITKFKNEFDRS